MHGNKNNTEAVLVVTVANAGGMQTAITNWGVSAIVDVQKYSGMIIDIPENISFDTSDHGAGTPTSMNYPDADNIVNKALAPVQTGAPVAGDLFVVFPKINSKVLRAGTIIAVSYKHILSTEYRNTITLGASFQLAPLCLVCIPGWYARCLWRPLKIRS